MTVEEIKQEICEVVHRLYDHGFVAANDGNISVKVGPNEYYCTPTGVSKGSLTPDMIIKIDGEMELDWDLIGYVDPSITVNIIRGGELQEKRTLKLPERIHGVLRCKNPRCITSTERELPQEFVLTDRERRVYRCLYCETKAEK